jgi:hypothetical protein
MSSPLPEIQNSGQAEQVLPQKSKHLQRKRDESLPPLFPANQSHIQSEPQLKCIHAIIEKKKNCLHQQ